MANQPTPPSSPKKRIPSTKGPGIDTPVGGGTNWSPREIGEQSRGSLANPKDFQTATDTDYVQRRRRVEASERAIMSPPWKSSTKSLRGRR